MSNQNPTVTISESIQVQCSKCNGGVCSDCVMRGGVIIHTVQPARPPTSAVQAGQILIVLSLVGLVYLGYVSMESSPSSQTTLTLADAVTTAAISVVVISLVIGFLKFVRK